MDAALRLAICQIRSRPGDVPGNFARACRALDRARELGAGVALFPELALIGYTPADLLHRHSLLEAEQKALRALATRCRDIQALVGATHRREGAPGRPLLNGAYLLRDGAVALRFEKALLPHYDIFDEARHFEPGRSAGPVEIGGFRVGISICEDLWCEPDPREEVPTYALDACGDQARQGAQILLNLSASPYQRHRPAVREALVQRTATRTGCPLVLCNLVGGHDELLFDGASVAAAPGGDRPPVRLALAEEEVALVHVSPDGVEGPRAEWPSAGEELRRMLVLGVRDYARGCGFTSALVGSSGGIDSAVTAALAAEAFGAEKVQTVALPSEYSSDHGLEDAAELARLVGCRHDVLPIRGGYDALRDLALQVVGPGAFGALEENLQARTRGALLMGIANRTGALLLTTGNKSELALGYCTLYGDMCGGLAPLADLYKHEVYEVGRLLAEAGRLPPRVLEKEPSAELRPGQKDSDSLPPYPILDRILEEHLEGGRDGEEIARSTGYDQALVSEVLRRVARNEFKRVQAAPGLRVSAKAFGQGRRVPLIAPDLEWAHDFDPERG